MAGPKMDARTYALAVLIVITVLLSTKLIAQGGTAYVGTSADTGQVASANREIAQALNRVADANSKIADSIGLLANAVKDAGEAISKAKGEGPAPETYTGEGAEPAGDAPANGEPTPEKTPAGVFQMK